MRVLRTIVVALAVSFCGAACTSYIPTYYYGINTEPGVKLAANPYPFTIELRSLRAPSRYKDQMVYRTAEYRVGFYEYSQWVEPPAEMVGRALLNALKDSKLFVRVDPVGAILAPDLVLQGNITGFDQVVGEKAETAVCEMDLEIVPGAGGRPVWNYTAKATVEQKEKGAAGFVPAMVAAVDEAILKAIGAMEASTELREFAAEKKEPTVTPTATAR
ncbi:MAG: ABC-type transport auxiliary lipoprotein family protein [Candidatus Tritonobacter lacicola]|nr:ABC-type transport auxiliary lipoprotein family protein [Candidatus Tritonobacter lacicola]